MELYNLFTFQKAFEKFDHERLEKKLKSGSQSIVINQKTI